MLLMATDFSLHDTVAMHDTGTLTEVLQVTVAL